MSLRNLPEITAFQKHDALFFEPQQDEIEAFDPSLAMEGEDEDTISIYGEIGLNPISGVDNTERRINAALRAIGKKPVTVNVNSPGGNLFNGLSIYNSLRMHPEKVTVNIIGVAGSSASVIAMAGDEILMGKGSRIMVHNASGMILGNKFDAAEATELLTEMDNAMAEIYAARAGTDVKEAAKWMDRNRGSGTWFGAKVAIEKSLADGEFDDSKISVTAEVKEPIPTERVIEKSLIAGGMKPADAKILVSEFKGTRDAAAHVTRDADNELVAALQQLNKTINS